VTFEYRDESDLGPYPISPDAPIEGGGQSSGDRHVLVLERDNCILYELYMGYPQPDGTWQAGSGAVFDTLVSQLKLVTGADFEAVDESSLMVTVDSGQALQSMLPAPPSKLGIQGTP